MKRIVFLFVLVNLLLSAQTNRFIYEVRAKSPGHPSGADKSNYYLDVNDDKTIYYNRLYFLSDSLSKRDDGFGFDGFKMTDFVVSNKRGDYSEIKPLGINLINLKDKYDQNWQVEDERKDFQDRQLQKATAQFGGRNWTAWFSSDIPLPYGPYVFHGLPGTDC
ncbi:MAG: GLPGLI family protein [Chryseobacterium sp.]|nr:MAG: GLPGLI family protein [Chryseobacterium sp.]